MSEAVNITELLTDAADEGIISPESQQALTMFNDLEAQLQLGIGIRPEEVGRTQEVVLVNLLIDDSGSIRTSGNAPAVRDGHNEIIDALIASKEQDNILLLVRYLNGDVLCPYNHVKNAPKMTPQNYNPNKGTPLYDETVVFLGNALAKIQEFSLAGIPCRSISLIVTDGQDVSSHRARAEDVEFLVKDLLKTEQHIIATMGIGSDTEWGPVFDSMGIPSEWQLTPSATMSDIRQAFALFSQSAVRASQHAMPMSQLGGFGG